MSTSKTLKRLLGRLAREAFNNDHAHAALGAIGSTEWRHFFSQVKHQWSKKYLVDGDFDIRVSHVRVNTV